MEATLQKLFNISSLEEVTAGQLKSVSDRYPYFAPVQYFSAYQLKQKQEAGFKDQYQKTLLYFQDPLWLQEQLRSFPAVKKAAPSLSETAQKETPKEEFPIFQAYHTVDYFASQGIKISADMLQTDKFGRQLRSFTEWLKTMKRLPAAKDATPAENIQDPGVRRFAESSLREGEILTEAMAEVFAKQGKKQEASTIYHKLGLLNPQRSAYFAAKIEALKAV